MRYVLHRHFCREQLSEIFRVKFAAALLALFVLAPDAAAGDAGVQLQAESRSRLGIRVTSLEAKESQPVVTGYGVVIDLEKLAQVDADLATAEAAAKTSDDALERIRKLFERKVAARPALDSAENLAAADAAKLALAQRRAMFVLGVHPPWKTPQERARTMADLEEGGVVLVHATFPAGRVSTTPSVLGIARPLRTPSATVWTSTSIWNAPSDAAIPGRSFFALVRNSDLAQGERVVATAPQGDSIPGVVVPASAIVISEGTTWCYVMLEADTFARRAVDTGIPEGNGYFVAHGLTPGQRVVTAGAGLLLAHETNPVSEVGD
jgi:hypothetical protein